MQQKIIFLSPVFALGILFSIVPTFSFNLDSGVNANTGVFPTSIDTSDLTENEVRSYYSDLSPNLNGTALLTSLQPILKENHKWFSYDDIWDTSKITERDWNLSPLSDDELNNYNPDTDNPYVYLLYRSDNGTETATRANDSHTLYTNREHIWSHSHGFHNDDNGPAYSDMHHLMLADAKVNQDGHNNHPYGNVEVIDKVYDETSGGEPVKRRGTRGETTYDGITLTVFEPADEDKGDIARAMFYMAARYATFTSGNSDPWLELTDDPNLVDGASTPASETEHQSAKYGFLSTLLEWHHLDPVSDYEIHRNNLIYNNFQMNRNPFIDFPSWADAAFGSGVANASVDSVALVGEVTPPTPPEPEKEEVGIRIDGYDEVVPLGASYDKSSIKVSLMYSDNTSLDVSDSVSVSKIDTSKLGYQSVNVSYESFDEQIEIYVTNDGADVGETEVEEYSNIKTSTVDQTNVKDKDKTLSRTYGSYSNIVFDGDISNDEVWSMSLGNKGTFGDFDTGLNVGANTDAQYESNKLPSFIQNQPWFDTISVHNYLFYFGMNYDESRLAGIDFKLYNEKDLTGYIIYSTDSGNTYNLLKEVELTSHVDLSSNPNVIGAKLDANMAHIRFGILLGIDTTEQGRRNRIIGVDFYRLTTPSLVHDITPLEQARAYAQYFLDTTSPYCGGMNASFDMFKGALEDGAWANLEDEFTYMISLSQNVFINSDDSLILEARTRYTVIINNYSDEGVNDFMALGVNDINDRWLGEYHLEAIISSVVIIIFIGSVSIVVFMTFKRKKNCR